MSAGMSDSNATTNTSTMNTDNRLTTESGDIATLGQGTVNVNSGGQLTLTMNDPGAARAALDAMSEQSAAQADAAARMVQNSNAAAEKVVKSQEQFVATATGQKAVLWIVAGLAAIVVIPTLLRKHA